MWTGVVGVWRVCSLWAGELFLGGVVATYHTTSTRTCGLLTPLLRDCPSLPRVSFSKKWINVPKKNLSSKALSPI